MTFNEGSNLGGKIQFCIMFDVLAGKELEIFGT